MGRKRHIIWASEINIDDWDFDEEGLTEEEKYYMAVTHNNSYIEDERMNLNIKLDNPILVIVDLGLWNGRKQGYKILKEKNINSILYSNADEVEWYSDGYNIRAKEIHYDGTNYLLYREIKNMDNIDNFLNKIYNNEEITNATLNYYTKSINKHVKDFYGW